MKKITSIFKAVSKAVAAPFKYLAGRVAVDVQSIKDAWADKDVLGVLKGVCVTVADSLLLLSCLPAAGVLVISTGCTAAVMELAGDDESALMAFALTAAVGYLMQLCINYGIRVCRIPILPPIVSYPVTIFCVLRDLSLFSQLA